MDQTFNFHIELSKKCALKCPRCPRTEAPDMYKVTELDIDFIKRVFTVEIVNNMNRLLICGGEGDPIYCRDFLKIVRYFKTLNPLLSVDIISNGSYKTREWWLELAEILNEHDNFVFSLDGWDQSSNEKYRVNCDWESILTGIHAMRGNDFQLIWSLIVFRFNENHLQKARDLAKDLGFDYFYTVQSPLFGSRNPKYIDTELGYDPLEPVLTNQKDNNVHLRMSEKLTDSPKRVQTFFTRYQKRLKKVSEKYKSNDLIPMCQAGESGLYITADGTLFPCSWVSHPFKDSISSNSRPGLSEKWEDSFFIKNTKNWNLKKASLHEVMTSKTWMQMEQLWKDKNCVPVICELKCHRTICEQRNILPRNPTPSGKQAQI